MRPHPISEPEDADRRLEVQIEIARGEILTAVTRRDRIAAAQKLKRLVGQRSAEQVKRMEIERGLR